MELGGAVVLVSGGASGLGAATAQRLLKDGAMVVVADIDEARGNEFARRNGGTFIRTDVTDPQQVQAAVAIAEEMGTLRGLVNCAGILASDRTVRADGAPHDLELFRAVIEVNLIGTFNFIRLAAAAMAKTAPIDMDGTRGAIVNTASNSAADGTRGKAAYSASKAAVVGLTIPVARDLDRLGIRVNTISPGPFDTPMLSDRARRTLGSRVLFPTRLGRSDEYAELAHMLLTNDYMNGATLSLDGGGRSDRPPSLGERVSNKLRPITSQKKPPPLS